MACDIIYQRGPLRGRRCCEVKRTCHNSSHYEMRRKMKRLNCNIIMKCDKTVYKLKCLLLVNNHAIRKEMDEVDK